MASGKNPALVAGTDVWAQYWTRDSGSSFQTTVSDGLWFELGP
jgi:hypothetical protein